MRRLRVYVTGLAVAVALGSSVVPAHAAQSPPFDPVRFDAALRSAASSNRIIEAFYRARGYRPLWFSGRTLSLAGQQVVERISSAQFDGLDPEDYRIRRIVNALEDVADGSDRDVARAEILISRALVSYVRDLHKPPRGGMTYVDAILEPAPPAPRAILEAAGAGRPLDQVTQMHPLYSQLRAGYVAWRERWGRLPEIPVPTGPALAVGAKGDRVSLLRQRLGLPAGNVFDKRLAAGVRAYKEAHGLPATPVVDDRTVVMLNQPLQQQDATIRVNLQRARLLPPPERGRHVLVDAAAARLWLYDGDRVHDSMRVVVGRPTEPTPMMAGLIRYAALNPYWNVPPDLVARRIAPGVLSEGLGFLKIKGYEVLSDWSDHAEPIDPSTVDWKAVAAGKVELPVRQLPGPANMMGAMKFMFPNELGVYLHDTPEKDLFGLADRRKSSGCVRVQDARRLALWLFGRVPTASSSDAEQHVTLEKPVPVYITYLTAAPHGTGIAFRDDFYGRDDGSKTRLAAAN